MIQPSNEEVDFKKYIYNTYREHFDPFLRLHALAERSLGNFKGFVKDHYDASLVLIFPRAYKSYDSIRRLCEVALCEDAAVILRCLLNLLVVTRWLSLNPKVRAEKYLRWYWVEMYREAEQSPTLYPAAHLSEIRTKYAAFKSLFEYADVKGQSRMAKQWYVPDVNTIFDMFKEVDMGKNITRKPISPCLELSTQMPWPISRWSRLRSSWATRDSLQFRAICSSLTICEMRFNTSEIFLGCATRQSP